MILALALLALAAPPPDAAPAAPTRAAPEVVAQVRALLGAFERPVSPEAFRRLGPDGEAALAEVARSGDLPPRRARALEVLAALRSPRAEEAHRAAARSPDASATVRRAAVLGLGRLLAPSRAAAELRPYLEGDRDPRVRAAAAEALAGAAPEAACGPIRAQARREGAEGVERFGRALAACGEREQRRQDVRGR